MIDFDDNVDAIPRPTSGERLRVLFISDTSRNGGPGRTILYILKFLDPSRVHRTVLIPRTGIVSDRLLNARVAEELRFEPGMIENLYEPLTRPIERRDFDAAVAVKGLRVAGNVFRAIAAFLRLSRYVRRSRFDVIFCNGTSAGFLGGALAAATKVPAIWHVLYPSVSPMVRPLHRWLAANENVRTIICVSRQTALQFDHCADKVLRIQTALDVEEFDLHSSVPLLRKELGVDDQTVIFGSHGRILPRKGFVELIRAARIVFDRMNEEDRRRCRFIILGDTPQDMRPDHLQECRSLVEELNLAKYVQFIGFRPDVRPYVADFDVAVVPSVYEDPLPRAVMEAMAMSKPVVAFAMGGIAEMIEDGMEGRLVCGRPPDIEGLAAACLDYFFNSELRKRHGTAARSRVELDFDARKHGSKLQAEMFRVSTSNRPADFAGQYKPSTPRRVGR